MQVFSKIVKLLIIQEENRTTNDRVFPVPPIIIHVYSIHPLSYGWNTLRLY